MVTDALQNMYNMTAVQYFVTTAVRVNSALASVLIELFWHLL